MATIVPKDPVQQSKPEVIFVADQSGSMQGPRTKTLVAALRVFLKSLPVGVKFNICYFGTGHSFLFPESKVYDQNTLEKALQSLNGLDGNDGGTYTLSAVRASVKSRDNTLVSTLSDYLFLIWDDIITRETCSGCKRGPEFPLGCLIARTFALKGC